MKRAGFGSQNDVKGTSDKSSRYSELSEAFNRRIDSLPLGVQNVQSFFTANFHNANHHKEDGPDIFFTANSHNANHHKEDGPDIFTANSHNANHHKGDGPDIFYSKFPQCKPS